MGGQLTVSSVARGRASGRARAATPRFEKPSSDSTRRQRALCPSGRPRKKKRFAGMGPFVRKPGTLRADEDVSEFLGKRSPEVEDAASEANPKEPGRPKVSLRPWSPASDFFMRPFGEKVKPSSCPWGSNGPSSAVFFGLLRACTPEKSPGSGNWRGTGLDLRADDRRYPHSWNLLYSPSRPPKYRSINSP